MFRILNTLNKACYEHNYWKTLPFTEERDIVVDRYVHRKEILNRLEFRIKQLLKRS